MKSIFGLLLASLTAAQIPPPTPGKGSYTQPPILGLGTWHLKGTNATEAVANAIVSGYRHIDDAWIYENQREVGAGIREGIRRAGITRADVWVTSKLWGSKHEKALYGLDETLDELGLDYLDLFLVHWPVGNSTGRNSFDHLTAWKGMESLVQSDKVRYIGISNFSPKQVDAVLKIAKVKPLTHQIELHPYLAQTDFVKDLQSKDMLVVGYSPLANTNPVYGSWGTRTQKLLTHPTMLSIASERGCTPAQVALVWNMRRNVIVIPKAASRAHQAENIAAYSKCKITDADSLRIDALSAKKQFRMNGNFCSAPPLSNGCWEGLALGLQRD